jgi:threonine dehydrogenase-like Zn-dependent dehydrogenase
VGVRVLAERGRLVYTGVATPERWESTPIYFKEITIAGSNAFGMEDFEGRRLHAIALYLELVRDGRLDITPMLTHRFGLQEWWPALKALARQDQSGALKVAFTPNV